MHLPCLADSVGCASKCYFTNLPSQSIVYVSICGDTNLRCGLLNDIIIMCTTFQETSWNLRDGHWSTLIFFYMLYLLLLLWIAHPQDYSSLSCLGLCSVISLFQPLYLLHISVSGRQTCNNWCAHTKHMTRGYQMNVSAKCDCAYNSTLMCLSVLYKCPLHNQGTLCCIPSICALLVLFNSQRGRFLAKLTNEMETVQWKEGSSFSLCACP